MGIPFPPSPDPCYGRTFIGPELVLEPTNCDVACAYIFSGGAWQYILMTWPDCEGLYFCILTDCYCEIGVSANGVYTAVADVAAYADPYWAGDAYLRRYQIDALGPWLPGMVREEPPENPLTGKFEHYHWNDEGMEWVLMAHGADNSNILIKYDPTQIPLGPY